MKKLLIISLILLMLITITAAEIITTNKYLESKDKAILDNAGLQDYKKIINYYGNGNTKEVCFFKKDIVNTCYEISSYDEIEDKDKLVLKLSNAEDDMINRVLIYQNEKDNKDNKQKTSNQENVLILEKK